MKKKEVVDLDELYNQVKFLLELGRNKSCKAINFFMIETYWNIGKAIVKEEQIGSNRAEYGKEVISVLSKRLTGDYGNGYSRTNILYMRQFYLTFPILHALSAELSWTHYRLILKVDKERARDFYILECIKNNWLTQELERQINGLLFERNEISRSIELR